MYCDLFFSVIFFYCIILLGYCIRIMLASYNGLENAPHSYFLKEFVRVLLISSLTYARLFRFYASSVSNLVSYTFFTNLFISSESPNLLAKTYSNTPLFFQLKSVGSTAILHPSFLKLIICPLSLFF